MASSKMMASTSNTRNTDLSPLSTHHHHHHHSHLLHRSAVAMISDFPQKSDCHRDNPGNNLPPPMFYGENPAMETPSTALLDAEITLIDAAGAISAIDEAAEPSIRRENRRTVDDVWREIMAGKTAEKKAAECKVEASDEMMTLEDFLAKAGAGVGESEEEREDVKMVGSDSGGGLFAFDNAMVVSVVPGAYPLQQQSMEDMGYGNGCGVDVVVAGRGKRRGTPILEPLDKAAQQRQRRMIKNRESAARSRERKQAYQVELEQLAFKLEEENEQLLREKAERTKERYKQLMEKVIPVVENRRPPRLLKRVRSMQW